MSKTITIKIKKAGNRTSTFSISDNIGNVLGTDVPKQSLISGISYIVADNVTVVVITSTGKNCCSKSWNIPVSTITQVELAAIEFEPKNTASLWSHLQNFITYNHFYGCAHKYIVEYPYSYDYYDEIVQSLKDYTKVYTYLPSVGGNFDINRKIQTNDKYFNQAILYNDQQSSGVLQLVAKPANNLSSYLSYPKYNSDSKTILFAKSDNFYQINTFWDIVRDKTAPLFTNSCESLSIDKEVNQDNMTYTNMAYKKYKLRAKDLRIRMIYTDTDSHLVSQFTNETSQLSFK